MFSLPFSYEVEVIEEKKKKSVILKKNDNIVFQPKIVQSLPPAFTVKLKDYSRDIIFFSGENYFVIKASIFLEKFSQYSENRFIKELEDGDISSFMYMFFYKKEKENNFDNVKKVLSSNLEEKSSLMKRITDDFYYVNGELYIPVVTPVLSVALVSESYTEINMEKKFFIPYGDISYNFFKPDQKIDRRLSFNIPINQIPYYKFEELENIEYFNISDQDCFLQKYPVIDNNYFNNIENIIRNFSKDIPVKTLNKDFIVDMMEFYNVCENYQDREFNTNCLMFMSALEKINSYFHEKSENHYALSIFIEILKIILEFS